ncbi:MAG: (d)CMP kinase [Gammaproteobacteria bacterium]
MYNGTPVITIDGPGGAGKGTIGRLLAKRLGFHFLDSGALYRLLALAAVRHEVDGQDEAQLVQMARHLDVSFKDECHTGRPMVFFEGHEVSEAMRSEAVGNGASRIAAIPAIRTALLQRQRDFVAAPGLVADGRDMGTVVFPEADLKIFLTASSSERAARRYGELQQRGVNVTLAALLLEIQERDMRDQNRAVAPLKPAPDGVIMDSTGRTILEVLEMVMIEVQARGLGGYGLL